MSVYTFESQFYFNIFYPAFVCLYLFFVSDRINVGINLKQLIQRLLYSCDGIYLKYFETTVKAGNIW